MPAKKKPSVKRSSKISVPILRHSHIPYQKIGELLHIRCVSPNVYSFELVRASGAFKVELHATRFGSVSFRLLYARNSSRHTTTDCVWTVLKNQTGIEEEDRQLLLDLYTAESEQQDAERKVAVNEWKRTIRTATAAWAPLSGKGNHV